MLAKCQGRLDDGHEESAILLGDGLGLDHGHGRGADQLHRLVALEAGGFGFLGAVAGGGALQAPGETKIRLRENETKIRSASRAGCKTRKSECSRNREIPWTLCLGNASLPSQFIGTSWVLRPSAMESRGLSEKSEAQAQRVENF